MRKTNTRVVHWIFLLLVAVISYNFHYYEPLADRIRDVVISTLLASIAFRIANWLMREMFGLEKWLSALLISLGAAFAMRLCNIRLVTPRGLFSSETIATAVGVLLVIALPAAMLISARVRETIRVAAFRIFALPTPLFGAARIFGYIVLAVFYKTAENMAYGYSGSVFNGRGSDQFAGTIFLGIVFFIFSLTLLDTLIGAWETAGKVTKLRGQFKEATKGFADEYCFHDGVFAGFASNPATRTLVISARQIVNGTSAGQPNELLTLSFDDIRDMGTTAPGYQWDGMLVGAGYSVMAQSAVVSLNDFTRQRLEGSIDTGIWIATRSGDAYLVQVPERKLPKIAAMLGKTVGS